MNLPHLHSLSPPRQDRGFVLVLALIGAVVPLVLIVGAASKTMTSRQSRLDKEIADERALLAAESGVDQAVYLASISPGLVNGQVVTRDLGNGMSFTIRVTRLDQDLIDNNGNGVTDEAAENQLQVVVQGNYRTIDRRLVAYLGPQTPPLATMPSAVYITKIPAGQELHVIGSSRIDGHDTNINMTAGPGPTMPGTTTLAPQTTAQLTNMIPAANRANVQGSGATTPSVGVTNTSIDFAATRLLIQNSANVVLSSSGYSNLQFGNGSTNSFNVIYRNGSVQFQGNTRGAGIMFINGNLHVQDTFRFDGIIYVTGDVEIHGTSTILGAIVTGTSSPHFYLEDTSRVYYSSQAISAATAVLPNKYLAFNGWQEIRR